MTKITTNQPQLESTLDVEPTSSDDILLGAYLINHLKSHCENCGTFNTPQWRKGWFSTVLNRSVLLCNACGLKYHKSQFCPYCMFVYGKEHDRVNQGWIACSSCTRWVHTDCEAAHGTHYKSHDHSKIAYACPDCKSQKVQNSTTLTHNPPHFSGIKIPSNSKAAPIASYFIKQEQVFPRLESPDSRNAADDVDMDTLAQQSL